MNLSPFQQKLKESTQEIHSTCENHPFMQSMIKGTVTQEQHLKFLTNILPIYNVVEQRLLADNLLDVKDLKRSDYIESDINTLIADFKDKETLVFTMVPLDITTNWVSSAWKKPKDLLKAELYTRWLADFYGGRILAKSVTPNASYTCNNPQEVIMFIRDVLDKPLYGVTEDELIQETIAFFQYHLVLFDEITNGITRTN